MTHTAMTCEMSLKSKVLSSQWISPSALTYLDCATDISFKKHGYVDVNVVCAILEESIRNADRMPEDLPDLLRILNLLLK